MSPLPMMHRASLYKDPPTLVLAPHRPQTWGWQLGGMECFLAFCDSSVINYCHQNLS